jgi:hypothetical protein
MGNSPIRGWGWEQISPHKGLNGGNFIPIRFHGARSGTQSLVPVPHGDLSTTRPGNPQYSRPNTYVHIKCKTLTFQHLSSLPSSHPQFPSHARWLAQAHSWSLSQVLGSWLLLPRRLPALQAAPREGQQASGAAWRQREARGTVLLEIHKAVDSHHPAPTMASPGAARKRSWE